MPEMTLIRVPRPPKTAWNPDRPVSSLLQTQIEHLHHAEKRLPLRYRSNIYINAIKTERQAARYVRNVTDAIHKGHRDAARVRQEPKRTRTLEIAAVAPDASVGKRARRSGAKKTKMKTGRKK
jgi:hypothetical protein